MGRRGRGGCGREARRADQALVGKPGQPWFFWTFSGYREFKDQFVRHYQDDLVRGILKRLTLYGTGRIPNVLDLKSIDEITRESRKSDYRLQDLLLALLQSPVFRDHQTSTPLRQ